MDDPALVSTERFNASVALFDAMILRSYRYNTLSELCTEFASVGEECLPGSDWSKLRLVGQKGSFGTPELMEWTQSAFAGALTVANNRSAYIEFMFSNTTSGVILAPKVVLGADVHSVRSLDDYKALDFTYISIDDLHYEHGTKMIKVRRSIEKSIPGFKSSLVEYLFDLTITACLLREFAGAIPFSPTLSEVGTRARGALYMIGKSGDAFSTSKIAYL